MSQFSQVEVTLEDRRFVIRNREGADVLGGAVEYRNAYISLYPSKRDGKPVQELGVDEAATVEIALCGTAGRYTITRVK